MNEKEITKRTQLEINLITDLIKDDTIDPVEELSKKYIDLFYSFQQLQQEFKEFKELAEKSVTENAHLKQELSKTTIQKQTLEQLSREFEKKHKQTQKDLKEQAILKDQEILRLSEKHQKQLQVLKEIISESKIHSRFKQFLKEFNLKTQLLDQLSKKSQIEQDILTEKLLSCKTQLNHQLELNGEKDQYIQELKQCVLEYMEKFKEIQKDCKIMKDLVKQMSSSSDPHSNSQSDSVDSKILEFKKELDASKSVIHKLQCEKEYLSFELSASESKNVKLEMKVLELQDSLKRK